MRKKLIPFFLCAVLLISGCAASPVDSTSPTESSSERTIQASTSPQQEATAPANTPSDISGLFSDRDLEGTYNENDAISIQLNGSSANCDSPSVEISGSEITIREEGVYLLSGTLDNGMVIVDADKESKIQLVLKAASIHAESCAPIYILQADKVFLTLAEGTENTLSNGGSFVSRDGNDIDGVIFSKDDLTINGTGALTITSPAGHGIVSKDELTITGGTIFITSASHGLCGKDSVAISGGSFTLDTGKDGIRSNNDEEPSVGFVYIGGGSYSICSEGDGISASAHMQLDGGNFNILTGGGSANAAPHASDPWGGFGGGGGRGGFGGERGGMDRFQNSTTTEDSASTKAIKASGELVINGGSYSIDSADDAIHSNASICVTGGEFTLSTGDDGFHADDALTIKGGTIVITESYEGLEGLSIDISGGNISLVSGDDGLNAAGGNDQSGFGGPRGGDMFAASPDSFITISGGTLVMDASGDGIDSNGDLTISGGHITVEGPTNSGNGSLDYGGSSSITGGTLIVTGSIGMAQTISSAAEQGVLAISTGNQAGGTAVEISDALGNVLLSFTPQKSYSCVIVSCPEMRVGEDYLFRIGDISKEFTAQ